MRGVDIDRIHRMRRAARTDGNQKRIVDGLRAFGASVSVISNSGQGIPDLCVGYGGQTFLFELKDPTKPKADRQLTPDQVKWHKAWKGHVAVVETLEDALEELMGVS